MNIDYFGPFVLALAAPTMFAFVCRLSMLSFRTHAPLIIIMHVCLAISVAFSGYQAWLGIANLGDVATVLGSLAWIIVSYETWKGGVPDHFDTSPAPLDTLEYPRIHGGKK